MKRNIALIGFMGAGKTTAGNALARKLSRRFIEVDRLIEKMAGKTIAQIFSGEGEAAFRKLESEAIKDVSMEQNAVIACGGGIVLHRENIERLRKHALIVYLDVAPDILLERLKSSGEKRPLLNTPDREARINELLTQRKPLYESSADIKITISNKDINVVDRIIEELKAYESIDCKK